MYCADVITIRRIVSVEDDRLGTDVRPATSGVDAAHYHEILQRASAEIIQNRAVLRGPFNDSHSTVTNSYRILT
jgi:hypothetical protein